MPDESLTVTSISPEDKEAESVPSPPSMANLESALTKAQREARLWKARAIGIWISVVSFQLLWPVFLLLSMRMGFDDRIPDLLWPYWGRRRQTTIDDSCLEQLALQFLKDKIDSLARP